MAPLLLREEGLTRGSGINLRGGIDKNRYPPLRMGPQRERVLLRRCL